MMPLNDLFISYRHLDAQRLRPLVDRLRNLNLNVRIDEEEIADFAAVTRTISEGLANSKAVLARYSESYSLSRPCQSELTAAYLVAQREGDPRQRLFIVNPETKPDHVALPELKDQEYLSAPVIGIDAAYDRLATRMNNLALALGALDELGAPRALLEKALKVGAEHTDTIVRTWNLLLTLQEIGVHDQATLLIQDRLQWLLLADPSSLSAEQRQIRDRSEKYSP